MYQEILTKCILFSDLSKEELSYALQFFSATEKFYEKGDFFRILRMAV